MQKELTDKNEIIARIKKLDKVISQDFEKHWIWSKLSEWKKERFELTRKLEKMKDDERQIEEFLEKNKPMNKKKGILKIKERFISEWDLTRGDKR